MVAAEAGPPEVEVEKAGPRAMAAAQVGWWAGWLVEAGDLWRRHTSREASASESTSLSHWLSKRDRVMRAVRGTPLYV